MENPRDIPSTPRAHDDDSNRIGRRTALQALGVAVGATAVVGVVGIGAKLMSRKDGQSAEAGAQPNHDTAPKVGESFNGNVQSVDLFEGRLNPAEFVGKTDAELAEMMTVYVDKTIDVNDDDTVNWDICTKYVFNWEGATNAACTPLDVELAVETEGYVLEEAVDGPQKSISRDYGQYQQEHYGSMFDSLTPDLYEWRTEPGRVGSRSI